MRYRRLAKKDFGAKEPGRLGYGWAVERIDFDGMYRLLQKSRKEADIGINNALVEENEFAEMFEDVADTIKDPSLIRRWYEWLELVRAMRTAWSDLEQTLLVTRDFVEEWDKERKAKSFRLKKYRRGLR